MYDVLIAGAGPAGATCARLCALAGLKTALIDKNRFPRQKTCGGAVSGRALSYLDFPLPAELAVDECFGARIFHGRHSVIVRKKQRLAVLVERERFDELLLNKAIEAGAQFLPNEQAIEASIGDNSTILRTTAGVHESLFLIGADGVHSVVANSVRPRLSSEETSIALVSRIAVQGVPIGPPNQGFVDMHFGIAPQGYGWIFPCKTYYSVGVMGVASRFPHACAALEGFCSDIGMPPARVRGHLIPLGGIKREVTSRRVLLVGDAAGFADPFHGEGIAYAILSGRLAAESLCCVLVKGWEQTRALKRYERKCEQLIRKNLRVALWMARLLDRYPKLFVRIFFDNPDSLSRYMDISTGRLEYRQFWKWMVLRTPWNLLKSYLRTPRRVKTSITGSTKKMDTA